ncbi:hypothetical protein BGZ70_000669 [Mortierella alpina]|uniref:RhoGAP-domain-containing protein n=1 Tax=Mortierella alpina TaxID=64518 RepID=A0A9P6LYQ7_MORAP|nr:hypothetical protein BGZ70_000669 [Mortierella alpina]
MSQSGRSDQSLSQGQAPDLTSEAALQQVLSERNALRSQNDQLWKLIEKQRIIIQNLQKDVAKVTAERDLLRHFAAESEGFKSNSLASASSSNSNANGVQPSNHVQVNGHHQQSRRTLERKAQEGDTAPSSEQGAAANNDRDTKPDLVPHSPSSQSSSVSPKDLRLAQMDHSATNRSEQEAHVPKTPQSATTPLTPSSTYGEAEDILKDRTEESELSTRPEDDTEPRYDAEIQVASRVHHQAPLAASPVSPAIVVERDVRALPPRADFSSASFGHNPSPTFTGSPAGSRNVSGSISLGAIAQHLPHLPARSPRRERRDMGDGTSSPTASDNEDDSYPSANGTRSRGQPQRGDLPSPLSQPGMPDQDTSKLLTQHVNPHDSPAGPASPDCEVSQATNTYLGTATATRRMISAQIPTASLQTQGSQEPSPSPLMNMNPNSNPPSPIAAIIDQDAEKFRLYMSKLNSSSRKNVSAPIQLGLEGQDKAAALGQAVAMENIQNQLDIQNQLMGQVQGHGGRIGLNPVHGPTSSRGAGATVSGPINVYEPTLDSANTIRTSGDSHEQGSLADTLEKNGSQLSLPSENRSRKRDSSLQMLDDYPKIAARSTSHQRDEDDSGSGHGLMAPIPPRRFDSQYQNDPARVASPTPSGNSSLTNTLASLQASPGHSRAPTVYQQKFSTFTENLEFVSILVVGSNISTNDRGREQLTFLISIGQEERGEHDDAMYPHKEDDELWRVEKQYADFVNLDSKLRVTQSRNIVNSLPKLPDKSLFSTHAPSKVDARKVALEQYLQQVTSLRIKDTRDLCEFLSTNVVEREKRREGDSGWREGYLTKRGKNFGGWKTRYFILRGPVLEYFDSQKDGHHLGSIALTNAQIGRQQSQDKGQEGSGDGNNAADPNSYRHAFLILEPKKGQTVVDAKKNPNSVIRHVLCAETDQERDDWVEALMLYVGKDPSEVPDASNDRERSGRKIPEIQKLSATPIKELQSVKGNEKLLLNQDAYERQQRSVPPSQCPQQLGSQGRGGPIPQSPTTQGMSVDERSSAERPSDDNQYPATSKGNSPLQQQQQQQQQIPRSASSQSLPQDDGSPDSQGASPYFSTTDAAEKKQKSRMTFWAKKNVKDDGPVPMPSSSSQTGMLPPTGATSSQSSQDSSRLRQFLGKGNNSSSNINGTNPSAPPGPGSYPSLAPIRQVFGVTLEQAIEQAQVQPGYELPAVVYRCIEYLNAHKAKLEEGIYRLNGSAAVIKGLKERFNHDGDVALLAEEEYYDIHAVAGLLKLFLRDLPSSILTRELHRDFLQVIAHLIEIVDNADVNKMTARNVGIVFSPTLGIPAGVFALLMSDFDQIFHTDDGRIMPLENSDMQANRGPAPIAVLPVSATPPPLGSAGLTPPPDACMDGGTSALSV